MRRPNATIVRVAFLLILVGIIVARPRRHGPAGARGGDAAALLWGLVPLLAIVGAVVAFALVYAWWSVRRDRAAAKRMPRAVEIIVGGSRVSMMPGDLLPDGAPTAEALDTARRLVARLDEMRRRAADELLASYNEGWRPDGEPALTVEEFCARLVDPTIHLHEPDYATVSFDPSDMFGEHEVMVTVENGEIVDASMEG